MAGLVLAVGPATSFGLPPLAAVDIVSLATIGGVQVIGAVLIGLGWGAARRRVD